MGLLSFDFSLLFSFKSLFAIVFGTMAGLLVGALPGLGAAVGTALLIPVTYTMEPLPAVLMLVALYEAAELDGASKLRTFFKITLPMISPITLFNLVMQTIACLQEFTSVFVVTSGGPNKATYLYAYKMYLEGFSYYKMGYASALSWILFLIIFVITLLIFKSSKYWTYYEDGGELR